jgi:hypothetical protein
VLVILREGSTSSIEHCVVGDTDGDLEMAGGENLPSGLCPLARLDHELL